MEAIVRLGKYKHFKGFICNVIGIGRHSETMEKMVVYTHPNDNGEEEMWVRPVTIFLSKKRVDGELIDRFVYIGE